MVTQTTLSFAGAPEFRSVQSGLQRLVEDLTESAEIALARIWLIEPVEVCSVCRQEHAPNDEREASLHLVASSGRSVNSANPEVWNRLDGAFHRFPLNSQKIGRIAATGESLLVHRTGDGTVLAHPDWVSREGIQSFFGHPLTRDDRVFGVVAVFSRVSLSERDLRFLRQIADGAVRLMEDSVQLAEQGGRLREVESDNVHLRSVADAALTVEPLVVCGPASRKLDTQISMAAQNTKPVLITGARGTGKKLTARLIHSRSSSTSIPAGPFVKLRGAALTCELIESCQTIGTLLIDAVEQTPPAVQQRLLAMLLHPPCDAALSAVHAAVPAASHAVAHVTAHAVEHPPADRRQRTPRVMATSRVDLRSEVAAGRLRHDLYCALSVVEIEVPSLRQRLEDLPALASELLRHICGPQGRPLPELSDAELAQLARYEWPGNVRELRLVLECAVMRSPDGMISLEGLPKSDLPSEAGKCGASFVRADEMKRHERANIQACLSRCHWKVYGPGGAAELLGMKPTTLLYRMKVLRIRKPQR